ncbi:AzlC family ABC transporter permease [Sulfurospirillum arcachonense]|uniref:AzlC family ABC transporter permease n=1 Tax=Sulfurospirillum arcachonense TaxID=57666 RepID=UPI00046845B8|nr:AzlC family ABC transporter permease [Sulfurospirillum arcachonense]
MKNDFKNGFVANIPIGFSVAAYGSVCGMMSSQAGVEFYEMMLMNVFIFAGSSQMIIIEMWSDSLNVLGIILAALMINLRYFLIGASLSTLFQNSSKKEKLAYMHLCADENWAVTIAKAKKQDITPLFLFGGGVCLLLIWSASTSAGFVLGEFISDPSKYALDFAFVAIFTALTFNMYHGKNNLIPWVIAALVAIVAEYFIAGKFYIVFGALAGSFSAVYLHKDEDE